MSLGESGNDSPGTASSASASPLRVDLRFASFTEFISAYGKLVSTAGMFLVSDSPPSVGSRVALRLRLDDGFPLILAEAQVLWLGRVDSSPAAPSGAALRFLSLDERSTTLIDHMVAQQRRDGGRLFDLTPPAPQPSDQSVGRSTEADAGVDGPVVPEDDPWAAETAAVPAALPTGPETAAQDVFETAETSPLTDRQPAGREASRLLLSEALGEPSPAADRPPAIDYAPARAEDEPAPARSWLAQPTTIVGMLAAAVLAVWVFSALRSDQQPPPTVEVAAAATAPVSSPASPTQAPPATAAAAPSQPAVPPHARAAATPPPQTDSPLIPTRRAQPPPIATAAVPATRVVDISWRHTDGTTKVVIETDGAVSPARVRHFDMDNPPRFVVRLLRIRQPYQPYELAVATPQLSRIRVGYHEERRPPELHIVLDLADPGQRILGVDIGSRSLTVTIGSSQEREGSSSHPSRRNRS